MYTPEEVFITKSAVGTEEKLSVPRRPGNEFCHRRRIGQIAAAFARNAHLFPYNIIFFKKLYAGSSGGSCQGSKDACSTCTDDYNLFHRY